MGTGERILSFHRDWSSVFRKKVEKFRIESRFDRLPPGMRLESGEHSLSNNNNNVRSSWSGQAGFSMVWTSLIGWRHLYRKFAARVLARYSSIMP